MVTPASGGKINPLVLAAAKRAGVREIYRIGGAQAVAALAYGTATIAPVDKIVGPGNAYVAAAKREVFGQVGIDSIAGPSEILVVADGANNPDWIAADLLSQAEHDAIVAKHSDHRRCRFRRQVAAAIDRALASCCRARRSRAPAGTTHGAIIVVAKLDDAAALVDRIAPEHLEIATADPRSLARARAPCRRDLPGPPHAGSDGRLHRRAQPRAADVAHGAVFLRAFGAGFHETHHASCHASADAIARARPRRHRRWRKPKGWTRMRAPSPRG